MLFYDAVFAASLSHGAMIDRMGLFVQGKVNNPEAVWRLASRRRHVRYAHFRRS